MGTSTFDVVISGAGPAGIATAVALARARPELVAGRRLVCLERARFPREKPCGGGLTGHAQAALQALGLAVRVPAVPCRTGEIIYGRVRETVALERPVEIIRRAEFDADLVSQARALGIEVIEGESVVGHEVVDPSGEDRGQHLPRQPLAPGRGCVVVTTSLGRRLEARVLVAADGAGSRIRQSLVEGDPHAPARPLRLFKHEVVLPGPTPAQMIYDFSPMQAGLRGYVWLFPVEGARLNVGVMHYPSRRLGGAELERLLADTLARHGVHLPSTARGWPAWPYAPRARISGPHVLCVGDAAGIDALTGEGIAVGLEHGTIAAAAIVGALDRGDFSFEGYRSEVARATVGRELTLDGRIAARLYAGRGFRYWLPLVLFDARVRALYAARVCGSLVLADRVGALLGAFVRHLFAAPLRMRRLARLAPAGSPGTKNEAARVR